MSIMLDGAQTLIGVLTTLVVLCLFYNKQNFFAVFLDHLTKEVLDDLKKKKEKHAKKARARIAVVTKLFSENKETLGQEHVLDAIKNPLILYQHIIQVDLSRCTRAAKILLERTEKAKEFGFVALYSFFFCLLILTLDCSLGSSLDNCLFVRVMLYNFTVASFVFTCFIWISLWQRTSYAFLKRWKKATNQSRVDEQKNKSRLWLWLSSMSNDISDDISKSRLLIWLYSIVLCIIIPAAGMCVLNTYIDNNTYHLGATFLLYCIMFYIATNKRLRRVRRTQDFNRHLIVSHFVLILLSSVLIALASLWHSSIIWSDMNTLYDLYNIKYLLICFALLSIVLIPLVLSYIKLWFIKCPLVHYREGMELKKSTKKIKRKVYKIVKLEKRKKKAQEDLNT